MNNRPFNARSHAPRKKPESGEGDDVACAKCGAVALDTGLECSECGHDNYEAVTGKPFGVSAKAANGVQIVPKRTCIAVLKDDCYVASFVGPDCDEHARIFAAAIGVKEQCNG